MRTHRHLWTAALACTMAVLLAGCDTPDMGGPDVGGPDAGGPPGPGYSVCRAPVPGTDYQVCG